MMMLPDPEAALERDVFRKDRRAVRLSGVRRPERRDRQQPPPAAGIIVDEHADAIPARSAGSTREADPMPALKSKGVHAGAGADASAFELSGLAESSSRTTSCAGDRARLDVVERRIVAFADDRQRNVVAAPTAG